MLGAVAAPTAGLHFDNAMLEKLKAKGVDTAFVTYVGAGTFQPVRVNIEDHKMRRICRSEPRSSLIKFSQRKPKKRVIAIGTTSVRLDLKVPPSAEKMGN